MQISVLSQFRNQQICYTGLELNYTYHFWIGLSVFADRFSTCNSI